MSAVEFMEMRARELGANPAEVIGPKRYPHLVRVRKAIARELRADPWKLSFPEIGRTLGGRHHTTAMYLCGSFDHEDVAPRAGESGERSLRR